MTRNIFAVRMLTDAAERQGLSFFIEPRYGYTGFIERTDGARRYFKDTVCDLNAMGASKTTRDKDYTCMFLQQSGLPVVQGKACYSKKWSREIHEAYDAEEPRRYAEHIGYPVILKPNSGSNGADVFVISSESELIPKLSYMFDLYDIVRIEEKVKGTDMRIMVLDGEVVLMIKREAAHVIGDGQQSVDALIKHMYTGSRHSKTRRRAREFVARQIGNLDTILKTGVVCTILPSANLSSGGQVTDMTDEVTEEIVAWARRVARTLNLTWCAIDLMAEHIHDPDSYVILEVNAAPSLKQFARSSPEALNRTQSIYDKMVQVMAS